MNSIVAENQNQKILITGATGNVGFEVVKSALMIGLNKDGDEDR